jgi:hypothetical protein
MKMRIIILPKSALGWWSVGLFVAWILFFVLADVLIGSSPNENIAFAYGLAISGIGTSAFVTGLISIIKSKERSILVFLTTAVGLYSLIGGITSLVHLAK